MKRSKWRARANAVIQRVVKANPGASNAELRRLANEAYPFGARENHPYRIWLSVIKDWFPLEKSELPEAVEILPLFSRKEHSLDR